MNRVALCVALLLTACNGRGADCEISPRPLAIPVSGDANGDGVVDIADGVAIHDALFRAGAAPPCAAAADVAPDGTVDVGDGAAIWYHLFFGNTVLYELPEPCAAPPADAGECGDGLRLDISAPEQANGSFEATISLTTPAFEARGWSISLVAEGCTVSAASTSGTRAADKREDPPGLRDGGLAMTQLSPGGLVAATVMDIPGDAALPRSDSPQPVLKLSVSASACGTCRLSLQDGQQGEGEPVDNVVAALGRSYAPALGSVEVSVCP